MKTDLTIAQIEEIVEILEAGGLSGEYVKELLTEKFGGVEELEEYFIINHVGNIVSWMFVPTDERCIAHKEIGNLYPTKEKAEAVVQLKKHIQKFLVTSNGTWNLFSSSLAKDCMMWEICEKKEYEIGYENGKITPIWFAKVNAGLIMPLSSTEEDRVERIRLLKSVYEN